MLVYASADGDPRRAGSLDVIDAISAARAAGVSSAAVIEELWHLELTGQVPGLAGQSRAAHRILRPLLEIDDEVLEIAFALELDGDAELGASDRLHAATCIRHGIADIVSADRGFDAVRELNRIDPIDARALEVLW